MKLPSIVITGSKQELIEIEPLLVMIGYDNLNKFDDDWNNYAIENTQDVCCIITYLDSSALYRNHYGIMNRPLFQSTNTKGIINYIEKYNKV